MQINKKLVTYLIMLVWLGAGLYIGIAGWEGSKLLQKTSEKPATATSGQSVEFEGLNFRDEASLRKFLRQRRTTRWAPWILRVPQDITPLIGAIGFGMLGGAVRLLKRLALDSKPITQNKLFGDPLFGAVLGVAMFFISLFPTLFTSKSLIPPAALVVVSFFGGIFSEEAYSWIEKQVKPYFSPETPQQTPRNTPKKSAKKPT